MHELGWASLAHVGPLFSPLRDSGDGSGGRSVPFVPTMRPSAWLVRLAGFAAAAAAAAAEPIKLRVMSFNIHAFRDASHRDNLEDLSRLLQQCKPDVVCLNEVLHPWSAPKPDDEYWQAVRERRGYGRIPPLGSMPLSPSSTHLYRLAEAAGLTHVVFGCASPERSFFGRVPFGNAVLSRYAMEDVTHGVMQPDPEVDLTLGEQGRTLDDLEARGVTTATLVLPQGRRLGVCVTHLDHKAEELREKQARQVLQAARRAFDAPPPSPIPPETARDAEAAGEAAGIPYFICGDLNSYDRRDMEESQWAELTALCDAKGWAAPRAASLVRQVLEDEGGLVDTFRLAPQRDEAAPEGSGEAGAAAYLPAATLEGRAPPTCWTGARLDYLLLQDAKGRVSVAAHRTLRHSTCSDHVPIVCDLLVE